MLILYTMDFEGLFQKIKLTEFRNYDKTLAEIKEDARIKYEKRLEEIEKRIYREILQHVEYVPLSSQSYENFKIRLNVNIPESIVYKLRKAGFHVWGEFDRDGDYTIITWYDKYAKVGETNFGRSRSVAERCLSVERQRNQFVTGPRNITNRR